MAMYIYASLPKSYGSFYQIQQDNYPFNRIFHKYIQRIVDVGIENDLDIFSLIGYIEHELSGDERLPDTPEGNQPITFRFSIEDETIEQYYRDQDLSNKMITQMIVRMTIRLADEYGTSLSRLATMIENIDEPVRTVNPTKEATTTKQRARHTQKERPAIRISDQEQKEEIKNAEPKEEIKNTEPKKEPTKKKQTKKNKAVDSDPSAESERLKRKLEELQKKQAEIEGRNDMADDDDNNDSQVVTTNPHLADFFG